MIVPTVVIHDEELIRVRRAGRQWVVSGEQSVCHQMLYRNLAGPFDDLTEAEFAGVEFRRLQVLTKDLTR